MGFVWGLVLLFLCSATIRDASALKCAGCIHLDFTPSPPPGFPNIYKNVHCADFHHTIMAGNSHDCPADGNYVCGTIKGVYTFDVPAAGSAVGLGLTKVNSTLRRCVPQPLGFPENSEPICLEGDNLDKAVNDINLVGANDEFGDMTKFEGQVCYCNGDNCNGARAMVGPALLLSLVLGVLVATVMSF